MRIPTATYRVQFNAGFGFNAAKKIIPYLKELGISDLYASPIFKARAGSLHGYDIVDPNQLNPELGTSADFAALIQEVQQQGMGWLQDIVPNHMAYDSQNSMLMDLLENGPNSDSFDYFDIDWHHYHEELHGRVLTPMLGDFYGNSLEKGEIQLQYDQNGLSVNYYDLKLPVRIESYAHFISYHLGQLARSLGRSHPDFIKLLAILYLIKGISDETQGYERYDQISFVKGLLWELHHQNPEVKQFIDDNIKFFNGEPGRPESFNLLDTLLAEQFYRLSFWKVGAEEINYRRFFTINELISIRIQEFKVFQQSHRLIEDLVTRGKVTGVRIDHIDGLYDPTQYLQRLRQKLGEVYLVVEKILEPQETLPSNWEIQGTSGYDLLNYLNGVFICQEHKAEFDQIYRRFTGITQTHQQVVSHCKRLIIDRNLAGDIDNLAHLIKQIANKTRKGNDFTLYGLRRAIAEFLAIFPIYRTYINAEGQRQTDSTYIQASLKAAREHTPQLANELHFLEKLLLLKFDPPLAQADRDQWLHLVMRLQQYTGPLMAKGVEDTAFYVYNRFLSLNEVGGHPDHFGVAIAEFHQFNQQRSQHWPHPLNATSTHDTKRGEDLRARLNVLSEIPEVWEQQVQIWREINQPYKTAAIDFNIPDENDEYLFYQNLLGAFPFAESEVQGLRQRIQDFMIKAIREAKVHTAWLRPDTNYEQGCLAFVEAVLDPVAENPFLEQFRPFQQKIADYGIYNSLSQTLLKGVVPGVPDFYQGTELWDFSLVDPDNRRPVNFEQRVSALREIKRQAQSDILGLIAELLAHRGDARIKLFLIAQILETRQQHPALFQEGNYLPLEVTGPLQDQVVALARQHQDAVAIAIAPRFFTRLIQPGEYPLGARWQQTSLKLPPGMPPTWRGVITNQTWETGDNLAIAQVLEHFPVALLIGQKGG